ncbi:MAG: hypothetical protein IJ226_00020 [Clostridia bacterium]|nr:hypothetical protein [Clostridia bacterium]
MSAEQAIQLGASTKTQAINFAICLGVGFVVGTVALLYFRRSSVAERFVTDLFATLALGGGSIAVVQLVFGGKFELYGLVSYALGVCALPAVYIAVKKLREKEKAGKGETTPEPTQNSTDE